MSDTMDAPPMVTRLRAAREYAELSREAVTRRPELDPPITTKTLERWELPGARVKRWRLKQLARIYDTTIQDLQERADP